MTNTNVEELLKSMQSINKHIVDSNDKNALKNWNELLISCCMNGTFEKMDKLMEEKR